MHGQLRAVLVRICAEAACALASRCGNAVPIFLSLGSLIKSNCVSSLQPYSPQFYEKENSPSWLPNALTEELSQPWASCFGCALHIEIFICSV